MEFSTSLSDVALPGFDGGKKPEANKAYVMMVVAAEECKTKAGAPQWLVHLDIAKGNSSNYFSKRPLRYYQGVSNNIGMQITKRALIDFVKSNRGMLTSKDIEGASFDFSKLQGLIIGAKLVLDDKGYLKVDRLFDADYVETYNEKNIKKPDTSINNVTTLGTTEAVPAPVAATTSDDIKLPF